MVKLSRNIIQKYYHHFIGITKQLAVFPIHAILFILRKKILFVLVGSRLKWINNSTLNRLPEFVSKLISPGTYQCSAFLSLNTFRLIMENNQKSRKEIFNRVPTIIIFGSSKLLSSKERSKIHESGYYEIESTVFTQWKIYRHISYYSRFDSFTPHKNILGKSIYQIHSIRKLPNHSILYG